MVSVVKSGTTITLGASGDTVTLASGACHLVLADRELLIGKQVVLKLQLLQQRDGEGYFVNTTSGGAITVNLPAGSAGAIVAYCRLCKNFAEQIILTITPNGSEKIQGVAKWNDSEIKQMDKQLHLFM